METGYVQPAATWTSLIEVTATAVLHRSRPWTSDAPEQCAESRGRNQLPFGKHTKSTKKLWKIIFFCVFWRVYQLSMVIFNSKVLKFRRAWPFSTGKIGKIRINQWMLSMMVAHDFFSRLHRCCQRIGPLYHAVVRHGIHGHNSKNAGWCFFNMRGWDESVIVKP